MSLSSHDFSKGPSKVYVEGFFVQIINGITHVVFKSGEDQHIFVIPLPGAKGLGRALTKQVEAIEKQTGQKFDVVLSDEPVPSPLSSNQKEK